MTLTFRTFIEVSPLTSFIAELSIKYALETMKATLDELQLGNRSHDKDLPQTLLKERVPHFPCFIGLLITYVSFIAFLVYEQKKKKGSFWSFYFLITS